MPYMQIEVTTSCLCVSTLSHPSELVICCVSHVDVNPRGVCSARNAVAAIVLNFFLFFYPRYPFFVCLGQRLAHPLFSVIGLSRIFGSVSSVISLLSHLATLLCNTVYGQDQAYVSASPSPNSTLARTSVRKIKFTALTLHSLSASTLAASVPDESKPHDHYWAKIKSNQRGGWARAGRSSARQEGVPHDQPVQEAVRGGRELLGAADGPARASGGGYLRPEAQALRARRPAGRVSDRLAQRPTLRATEHSLQYLCLRCYIFCGTQVFFVCTCWAASERASDLLCRGQL